MKRSRRASKAVGRKRRRCSRASASPSSSDYVVDATSDSSFHLSGDHEEHAMTDDDNTDVDAVPAPPPPVVPNIPDSSIRVRRQRNRKRGRGRGRTGHLLQWEILEDKFDAWLDKQEEESCDPPSVVMEAVEPSDDVLQQLLRFQKEWLAWALKQERSEFRGGILADEMGMGKTIQAIALVLASRSLRVSEELASSSSLQTLPRVGCTLVICPVVAVIQWVGEIERYTKKGSVRVLVYHGPNRSRNEPVFNDYDFVITTYSTIEGDYRKNIMPPKQMCNLCGKMLYPKKMTVHLKYYCGPNSSKTEKQSKQMKKNKKMKFDFKLKMVEVCSDGDEKVKGKKIKKKQHKKMNQEDEPRADSEGRSKGKSLLHSVCWERIILDEAHFIKERRCNTARAIFSLESLYKWCLSGTPLQNRVGELYSLVHFLQIYPYSFFFCKDCDCKALSFGMNKDCFSCSHSAVRHFSWWHRSISKPIKIGSSTREGKRAMVLLKEKVLKSVVLRRTKKERAADLALPPRIVTLRKDRFDRNEQEFYQALYTQSCVQFDAYVSAGTLMNNYAHIFDLLTRLRQAVDHPYLVVYSKTATPTERNNSAKSSCVICHDLAEDVVVTACEHVFCKSCLMDYSSIMVNVTCPSCSAPLTVDLRIKESNTNIVPKRVSKGILSRIDDLNNFQPSTKIDALREEIRNMLENDRSAKGIVFSQFTSFLDLINFSLHKSGIKCVQLVGSMSLVERERAIETFTNDSQCRIFLMSLKAGGVALNLTVASHVFLMDPWWNPAVERQAQDRIHRIGQYKPIRIVRFVIQNSVEERILKLQEKKELVFEGTVGHSSDAMAKLTDADLRFLFYG